MCNYKQDNILERQINDMNRERERERDRDRDRDTHEERNTCTIPAVTYLLFPQNSTVSFRKKLAKQ